MTGVKCGPQIKQMPLSCLRRLMQPAGNAPFHAPLQAAPLQRSTAQWRRPVAMDDLRSEETTSGREAWRPVNIEVRDLGQANGKCASNCAAIELCS